MLIRFLLYCTDMRQRDCEEPTHPPYRKVFQELRLTVRSYPRNGHSPEESAQHLRNPGLVIGGGDEARGLDHILRGVGHREGQVTLAHHGQVVTGVAEDGGLGALDAEEALEVAHGAGRRPLA